MAETTTALEVRLHDRPIGTITMLPGDRSIFAFHESYADDPERDTLSLSFKDEHGGLMTDLPSTGPSLLPFFSNLLPEGALRNYLTERLGVKSVRELHLLWALGQDLPGAITVRSVDGDEWPEKGPGGSSATRPDVPDSLRFSLAGIQLKFSALRNKGKHGGLTIPARGIGGSWIVKLPAERYEGVPENEFSMMTLAGRIGIDIPNIELVDIDAIANLPGNLGTLRGTKALAIRRFDRSDDGAVHIEDFAQVFGVHPDNKYGKASYRNIATVLGIETSESDIAEFIRRLVFSTLIGNDDMHLKNWSLIYSDRRAPSLAPAYDLLSTIAYLPSRTAALKYVRTDVMADAGQEEFAILADKAHLPRKLILDTVRDTVNAFLDVWAEDKAHLPLGKDVVEAVDAHLKGLALVRDT